MEKRLIPLFAGAYPEIRFVDTRTAKGDDYYATYRRRSGFRRRRARRSTRRFPPCRASPHGGLYSRPRPGRGPAASGGEEQGRPVEEPYVVIATQATSQCKYWNNPYGWREIIAFLKEAGYRVVCIDQKAAHGVGIVWNHVPARADLTGQLSLEDCVRWIRHAEFFVGLSSGLAWLAWAAGAPVVMISGFTLPSTEFETPYRVINYHACVGCWNDPALRFQNEDFLWCPHHTGERHASSNAPA